MTKTKLMLWLLCALSALLLSLPWLVPHTGALALVAFVPLLIVDAVVDQVKVRRSWVYPAVTFVTWNAATTFWVCNATVGGGIFAVVANAAQMLVIWLLFRLARRRFSGVLPYLFLAVMWIAWERLYFSAQISWPWLTLGGAFAQSTRTVQWYEYTGMLGGSLWVWMANLGVFALLAATTDGLWQRWNASVRSLALLAVTVVIAGPVVAGKWIWDRYEERSEGTLEVVIGQPNFDPYEKFESLTQDQQTAILLDLYEQALAGRPHAGPVLLLAPETFASDFLLNNLEGSRTLQQFRAFMDRHAGTEMLFGSSSYEIFDSHASPTILARPYGEGWIVSHNSAMLARPGSPVEVYHKSKLVVGTELTPYPKLFVPLDNWLSKKLGVGTLMGRCVGQDEVSLLHFGPGRAALGCAVCYESVYGEHCADYVRLGAQALTIITNDAWWGNTPGYRQHLSFARLRAIETRRDIARCGNTGISCFIDQRGEVLDQSEWWTRGTLSGEVHLNSEQTAFVRYGDIVGRICTLLFLLLAAILLVGAIASSRSGRRRGH